MDQDTEHGNREFISPMISIDRRLWNNLADLVQDMGRVHPAYIGTSTGDDIRVLGEAIRYCIEEGNHPHPQLQLEAESVIMKHGYELHSTNLVRRCIETATRLLGLPA